MDGKKAWNKIGDGGEGIKGMRWRGGIALGYNGRQGKGMAEHGDL